MKIGVPKEPSPIETRIAILPESVKKLVQLGLEIQIESGLGESLGYSNALYQEKGATISESSQTLRSTSDIIIKIQKPTQEEIQDLKVGTFHISFLDPFHNSALLESLNQKKISAFSLEMIPRLTQAQSMDVLSSQASLAGYVAVILAAQRLPKIFPLMMTSAGTLSPARVFIIGAGVAGLQAIATAKRLGAQVEAFDTRPVVEEQVKSLGAKFVKVDLGDTGQTEGGYAKTLTAEQLQKQKDMMAQHCKLADVVITTAQVFGKKAPRIITSNMIDTMRPGSLIVDMAVESGGNVEGSVVDEIITRQGVSILGFSNLAGKVPLHASEMLSGNLTHLMTYLWDKENQKLNLDVKDEILKSALITHQGLSLL
jgi:H+-translocating NAD(P) transhydrogenase subunit alpha